MTSQRLLPSAVDGVLNFEVRSPLLGLDCVIFFDCYLITVFEQPVRCLHACLAESWAALWIRCASVCELLVCTLLHDSMSTILTLFRLVHALTTTSSISLNVLQHISLITQHYFIFVNTRVSTSPPYRCVGTHDECLVCAPLAGARIATMRMVWGSGRVQGPSAAAWMTHFGGSRSC